MKADFPNKPLYGIGDIIIKDNDLNMICEVCSKHHSFLRKEYSYETISVKNNKEPKKIISEKEIYHGTRKETIKVQKSTKDPT